MTRRGECNILILHHHGEYQAWCKPHQWESPLFNAYSWAKAVGDEHSGEKEENVGGAP